VNTPGPADREGIDVSESTIQRLTLECGHLRISGPWDSPLNEDGQTRHMIGDITWCEVCPKFVVPISGIIRGKEMAVRTVVNVEPVPADQYREPGDRVARTRQDRVGG
jgi:hypothetical protein